ncbi:MAG: DUF1707 domain-containing protein [Mycobacterium sp.]
MSRYPDPADIVRASDTDRADVCGILDAAYADGELDPSEHCDRVAAATAAKTRGELRGLIGDLQSPTPAFARTADAPPPTPRRKHAAKIAAGCAAALAVIGAVFILTEKTPAPAPRQSVPAGSSGPTTQAPPSEITTAAAPTATVSRDDLSSMISSDYRDDTGHPPGRVDCPVDLPGQVGATVACTLVDSGVTHPATATTTAVSDDRISYRITISGIQN